MKCPTNHSTGCGFVAAGSLLVGDRIPGRSTDRPLPLSQATRSVDPNPGERCPPFSQAMRSIAGCTEKSHGCRMARKDTNVHMSKEEGGIPRTTGANGA